MAPTGTGRAQSGFDDSLSLSSRTKLAVNQLPARPGMRRALRPFAAQRSPPLRNEDRK
jgi:hypothetical protein